MNRNNYLQVLATHCLICHKNHEDLESCTSSTKENPATTTPCTEKCGKWFEKEKHEYAFCKNPFDCSKCLSRKMEEQTMRTKCQKCGAQEKIMSLSPTLTKAGKFHSKNGGMIMPAKIKSFIAKQKQKSYEKGKAEGSRGDYGREMYQRGRKEVIADFLEMLESYAKWPELSLGDVKGLGGYRSGMCVQYFGDKKKHEEQIEELKKRVQDLL